MITITTTSLPNGNAGQEYSFTLQFKATPAATSVQWAALNDLPKGLVLNSGTGLISGTCHDSFFASILFTVKNVDNGDKTQKILTLFIDDNDMILTGTVLPYAGPITKDNEGLIISQGWQICDGRTLSRTTYAALFGAINVLYGTGNDVDTFSLPDYRGQFLRGVSGDSGYDPNKDTRTAQQNITGGAGKASGNEVGTFQADEFREHNHKIMKWNRSFKGSDDPDKPYDDSGNLDGYTNNTGGAETRPVNVNVHYIIKF